MLDHYLHPIKADGLFDHPSRYPNDVSGIDFHDPLQPNHHKACTVNKCAKPIALAYAPGLNRGNKKAKSKAKQAKQSKNHTNSLQLFLLLIHISH